MLFQRMRIIVLMLLAISLLILPAMAQDDLSETFVTPGGLVVNYPSGMLAESDGAYSAIIIHPMGESMMIIAAGDELFTISDETPADVESGFEEANAALGLLGVVFDEESITDVAIGDRTGKQVAFTSDVFGNGYLVVFPLPDDTVAMALIIDMLGSGTLDAGLPTFIAVLSSAYIDPEMATEETGTEPSDSSVEEPITDEFVPEGALRPSEMPANTIIFQNGIQVLYPEGWSAVTDDYVVDIASLWSSDFSNLVTISDYGLSVEEELLYIMPTIAALAGDEEFNADEDMQVVELGGREVLLYDGSAAEEDGLAVLYYIVPVTDNLNITVQLMPATLTEEEAREVAEYIVSNITVPEGSTATTSEGVTLSVVDVTCTDAGQSYVNEDSPQIVATCPASCAETGGAIWGTDTYTSDSSICVAAIHAGVISDEGGQVLVTWQPGQEAYPSSEQNGVISSEWGEWDESFNVSSPE